MIFVNDLSPVLLEIGPLSVRWYGLLFASGIALNYLVLRWIFGREKYSLDLLDSVVMYFFVGLVVGARLGEVVFYNPAYYFANPVEILQIWKGGLASHGAAIGLLVAYLLWCRVHKVKFSKYINALVIPMPLTAAFVRLGNYFNSEIVGKITDGEFGVVFKRLGEDFPRHPAQLYEGAMSLAVFVVLMVLYRRGVGKGLPMFYLFLYLFLYFGGRFVVEFFKDVNSLPAEFPLNTGQVLSLVPAMVALGWGGYVYFRKKSV